MNANGTGPLRFGDYELDIGTGRLLRDGWPVKIQPQPLRVLGILVQRPGEIVTREELHARIWDQATFVEFDQGLNYCIRQIRLALRDDASKPVYIETLPKQGYRFIAEVASETLSEPKDSYPPLAPAGNGLAPGPPQASEAHQEPLPPSKLAGAPARNRYIRHIATAASLLALAAVGAWWMRAGHDSAITHPLQVTRLSRLTSYPGDEREPAISPDGAYVAFSWSGEAGNNYDIYVVQIGGQQPLRLTRDPAPDSFPAWSPDGRQIAFIRRNGGVADIIVVPPLGGPERTLHRFFRIGADLDFSQHPVLSWSEDGKWIVFSGQSGAGEKYRLFLLSIETGAVRAISSPDREISGDSSPALSADGRSLAFARYIGPLNGRILIQPLGPGMAPRGSPAEVPNSGLGVHSPVWLEDGKQLLFANATRIFQWERNKGTVPIYAADGALGGMSVGPTRGDHSRQVVVANQKRDPDIWAIPLNVGGTKLTGPPQVLQRSTASESHPDFSPDGRHIAFGSDRSGTWEIWVADADGGNPRQLTHLRAHVASYPKWSPDGTRVAFHARVPDVAEIYVVDVNQGVPQQITHENPGLALPTWSNDGRFLYAGTLVGGLGVIYRFPATGGPLERLWEGSLVRESVDGKYVLYWKTNTPGIFRRSLEGDLAKNREELLVPDFWPNNQLGGYAPVAGGVYYVSGDAQGRPAPFRFFDYSSRKSMDVAPAVRGLNDGFAISPDRRRMAFAASREIGGDLLLLELR